MQMVIGSGAMQGGAEVVDEATFPVLLLRYCLLLGRWGTARESGHAIHQWYTYMYIIDILQRCMNICMHAACIYTYMRLFVISSICICIHILI